MRTLHDTAARCWFALALAIFAAPGRAEDAAADKLPADLGTRATGDDWPAFLGPTGDSRSRETGIRTDWKKHPPKLLWQRPLATGYTTVAIGRGRLFEFARHGDAARVECWRSETAEPIWQFDYPSNYQDLYNYNNGPRCQPVVDGDRVYTFGAEGMLHCLGAEDGQMRWSVDTQQRFGVVQNFFGVGSTPVVHGELLLVHVGGSPADQQQLPPGRLDRVTGNGSGIVAFDKRTGQVKYQLSNELASYASPKLATINSRAWCFLFARGGMLAFNPDDGKIDFHFPWRSEILESVNASNPVVVNDLVFISEAYGPGAALLRVRPGGFDVVWSDSEHSPRQKTFQAHWNTPVHHDGYLYGSSGRHSENAELRCIELNTGKIMWSIPGLSRASLLYVDQHLICLTEYGDLLLLKASPKKFEVLGALALTDRAARDASGNDHLLKYPAWAAPILSHGLLYVRGADRLLCIDLIPVEKPAAENAK